MAAVAAGKFAASDNVQVTVSSFEDWDANGVAYDLVLAAASLHWVNPQVRFTKSAALLRQTGALAELSNRHVRKDEGFFARVQDVYRTQAPSMARIARERTQLWSEPVVGENLFDAPVVRKHLWVAEYSAGDYVALLGTYSDHLSLPGDERARLFAPIAGLIRDEYAGVVCDASSASTTRPC